MSMPTEPSLDLNGWNKTPIETLDMKLSNYFIADYSQSNLFEGRSYAVLFQQNKKIANLINAMEEDLKGLLGNHFDEVNVLVRENEEKKQNAFTVIEVELSVSYDGISYTPRYDVKLGTNLSKVLSILRNQSLL